MSDRPGDIPKGTIKGDQRRADRLAQELRANLKRRKARARTLASAKSDKPDTVDTNPDDGTA